MPYDQITTASHSTPAAKADRLDSQTLKIARVGDFTHDAAAPASNVIKISQQAQIAKSSPNHGGFPSKRLEVVVKKGVPLKIVTPYVLRNDDDISAPLDMIARNEAHQTIKPRDLVCFTPGTMIATPLGLRDIATLDVGDLVITRDHGMRPIRWIKSRSFDATGDEAPIRLKPGLIAGQDADLLVSPLHRMMFRGYQAELLFGDPEVMVAAKDLIDCDGVSQEHSDSVTYIHLMFDKHEVIYAEGAATESFYPTDEVLTVMSDAARAEMFAVFPKLRSDIAQFGETARRFLRRHEAQLIIG